MINFWESLKVLGWMRSEQYAPFDNNLIDHWLSNSPPPRRTASASQKEMGIDSFSNSTGSMNRGDNLVDLSEE